MKTYSNKVFPTKGADGKPNGRIIRVWERGVQHQDPRTGSYHDDAYRPGQVYVTTLLPGCSKGPHMHKRRDSLFVCVRGSVRIITREQGSVRIIAQGDNPPRYQYHTITSGLGIAGEVPIAVHVPAGTPCQIYNAGHEEALVINVSSEPYDASDEHEVLDWRPNE